MEIQSNDERAFKRVYEEVFPILMRVVYHVTGKDGDGRVPGVAPVDG